MISSPLCNKTSFIWPFSISTTSDLCWLLHKYIYIYIYINNLDDNITSNVLKFADDTKVFRKVNNDGDKQHLQNDLDKLVK